MLQLQNIIILLYHKRIQFAIAFQALSECCRELFCSVFAILQTVTSKRWMSLTVTYDLAGDKTSTLQETACIVLITAVRYFSMYISTVELSASFQTLTADTAAHWALHVLRVQTVFVDHKRDGYHHSAANLVAT